MCLSPDATRIVAGSRDGVVRVWGVDGRLHSGMTAHRHAVKSVTHSPTADVVVSVGVGSGGPRGGRPTDVFLWDYGRDRLVRLAVGSGQVCVAFSPDGSTVAVASGDIRLHDVSDGRESHPRVDVPDWSSLAFATDTRRLFVNGIFCGTQAFDITSGEEVGRIATGQAWCLACGTAVGKEVLAVGKHEGVELWDVQQAACVGTVRPDAAYGRVSHVDFAGVGQLLAVTECGHVVAGAGPTRCWVPPTPNRRCLAISRDVTRAASGHDDGKIILWDLAASLATSET